MLINENITNNWTSVDTINYSVIAIGYFKLQMMQGLRNDFLFFEFTDVYIHYLQNPIFAIFLN